MKCRALRTFRLSGSLYSRGKSFNEDEIYDVEMITEYIISKQNSDDVAAFSQDKFSTLFKIEGEILVLTEDIQTYAFDDYSDSTEWMAGELCHIKEIQHLWDFSTPGDEVGQMDNDLFKESFITLEDERNGKIKSIL